jgi:hypothetical protein
MILGDVMVPGKSLQCDACGWPNVDGRKHSKPWVSIGDRLPDACPNRDCRSREWNGVKKKRKPAPKLKIEIELPKPRRMRKEDYNDEF